jgi:type I restriction enzyme S subunit
MSEKRKVPKLRFQEFIIPWKEKTLSEEIQIFNGYAFPSTQSQVVGCRWIKIADVGINKINNSNMSYLPESFSSKYKKFLLKEGDVVVALTRPILSGKLKIAKIDRGSNNSLLNQRVGKLISSGDLGYAYQLFQRRSLIGRIENNIAGTDPPNLAPTDLSTFKIPFPSLPEQQKIATFLTAVDRRIELLEQKKEKLEAYKKGVMQQLFSRQIRFKQDDGSKFPDWEEKKLGEVLSIGSGRDYKHLNEGDIPIFGTGGLMGYVDDFLFEGESVGIGRKGTIDKPVFLTGKFWTVDTLFYTHSFENVTPGFIYRLFLTINWKRHNEASGVPSLSKATIEKLKSEIPSIGEQEKISRFLDSIDLLISNLQDQINHMQTWKKGLLQKMFI